MRTLRTGDDLRGSSLRLTAQFTALVLIILAIVGTIVYFIVCTSVTESNERALVAATRLDSPQDAPSGTFLSLIDGRTGNQLISSDDLPPGLLDTDAIRAVAGGGGDVQNRRTVDGRDYLLLTTSATGDRNHDRVVQVALDLHESTEELGRLATALIVGGLIAAVLAFAAAYLMARRAIRPLAEALALQRRFVADASHELRTPLTLLSTRAQMLKRRPGPDLPDDVTASVDEIVADTRALTEILEDLLIAADPRTVADPTPVDLAKVADDAIALLHDEATRRGVSLVRAGDPAPVTITGSRAALLRLVIALSTNALDHARSAVAVTVSASNGKAFVRVTDDGPGFPPEVASTAFDRFASRRNDDGATRHYGLGLAIVAEIVERHRGSVTIEHPQTGASVLCVFEPSR
ncbi:HAMP domain-containing histidine kinase [Herbiconiux sp. VKM Ac-1786]|uniref:sensor histidine kinase n=1 Tax=Herbiconiux sp. VKM Ac-1786 TaxID=2783824 RepID=UPI00188B737F|nr:HAMP domain-containing histidine kinase [Herbiconiux sp. VKM Ac-1786]